jgi:hypothetical protein
VTTTTTATVAAAAAAAAAAADEALQQEVQDTQTPHTPQHGQWQQKHPTCSCVNQLLQQLPQCAAMVGGVHAAAAALWVATGHAISPTAVAAASTTAAGTGGVTAGEEQTTTAATDHHHHHHQQQQHQQQHQQQVSLHYQLNLQVLEMFASLPWLPSTADPTKRRRRCSTPRRAT